jgi:hypothetical protein
MVKALHKNSIAFRNPYLGQVLGIKMFVVDRMDELGRSVFIICGGQST